MTIDLGSLTPSPGSVSSRKRLGRGPGSGLGKTSGKGHKGRGARSGGNTPPGYEGGQMPLQRRLPKRGFRSPFRVEYEIVNLADLAARFSSGQVVDHKALADARLTRRKLPVKILAHGEIDKALTVRADSFSVKAAAKISAAGGTAEVLRRA